MKEPKEEPLEFQPSSPIENKIPQPSFVGEQVCKKEEIDDEEFLGAVDQSGNDYISPLSPVEPKTEVIEDRVAFSVENPSGLKFFDYGEHEISPLFQGANEDQSSISLTEDGRNPNRPAILKHKFIDSIEDSMEVEIPEKRMFIQEGPTLSDNSVRKNWKKNDSELACLDCEYRTWSVHDWEKHLRLKHNSSPQQAGVILRCKCGQETHSSDHSFTCDVAKFTLVRGLLPVNFNHSGNKNISRENDTELECPKCEFKSKFVGTWYQHLSSKHSTTPKQEGLILRCACGNESRSAGHSYTCNVARFTVVRGVLPVNEPIKVSRKNDTELECPKCEFRTKSVGAWYQHLYVKHSTTPKQEGLILRCGCGDESRSDNHSYHCDISKITVIREEEITSICVEKWSNPRSEELLGAVEQSGNADMSLLSPVEPKPEVIEERVTISVENPNGLKVSDNGQVLPITEDCKVKGSPTTPRCVRCELHPKTASGYVMHLKMHKTTLKENGIYVKCSCGLEFRSDSFILSHKRKCDPYKFYLLKLEEE